MLRGTTQEGQVHTRVPALAALSSMCKGASGKVMPKGLVAWRDLLISDRGVHWAGIGCNNTEHGLEYK